MWFLYAFSAAFSESLNSLSSKFQIAKYDVGILAWAQRAFGLLIILPFALLHPWPSLNTTFWFATLASAVLNFLASLLYFRALRLAPLSVLAPIVTLTPVILLVTSPLITKEFPSLIGIGGVIISVVGAYILQSNLRTEGFWRPLTSLIRDPGPREMLGVAVLWGFSSPLDKIGVVNSSPLVYSAVIHMLLCAAFVPLLLRSKSKMDLFRWKGLWRFATVGIFSGLTAIFQMTAISLTHVAYVISVKRTSALFGIAWGKLFFKEAETRRRFIGGAIMLAGTILILFAE